MADVDVPSGFLLIREPACDVGIVSEHAVAHGSIRRALQLQVQQLLRLVGSLQHRQEIDATVLGAGELGGERYHFPARSDRLKEGLGAGPDDLLEG